MIPDVPSSSFFVNHLLLVKLSLRTGHSVLYFFDGVGFVLIKGVRQSFYGFTKVVVDAMF